MYSCSARVLTQQLAVTNVRLVVTLTELLAVRLVVTATVTQQLAVGLVEILAVRLVVTATVTQ